jgi:endonuclease III
LVFDSVEKSFSRTTSNIGQQGKTMGTAKATKAADKSQVCRKLVTALQKLYGKSVPKIDMSVVETMLFAACLEDNPWAAAETSLKKILSSYFDLNEIRVSSVTELEKTLAPLKDADWKGLRIRSILRYVFETTYSYDYEKLRRQTQEQAVKTLKKVNDITPFIRDFILHEILGSHVICLDTSMLTAATWLGLVPANSDVHDASEYLKGGIKKSEVSEFCHLLRCLATDPKYVPRFADAADSEVSMDDVMDRFAELQAPPKKKPSKPAAPVETHMPEKAASAKKPAALPVVEKTAPLKTSSSARPGHPAKPVIPPAAPAKVAAKPAAPAGKASTGKMPTKPAPTKTTAKPSDKGVSGSAARLGTAKPAAAKKAPSDSGKSAPRKPKK